MNNINIFIGTINVFTFYEKGLILLSSESKCQIKITLNIVQTIYDSLLDEIKNSGVDPRQLWQLWHGDSHVIADDKRKWKKECPTFTMIVDKIADYFHMDVKATRLNW